MRVRLFTGLGISLAIGTNACGDDTKSTSLPLSELKDAYADAACETFARCASAGGTLENMMYFLLSSDVEACKTNMATEFDSAILSSIDSGRITYDPVKAKACVDKLSSSCSNLEGDEPAECKEAFKGTVALGSACDMDNECTGDAFCKQDSTAPSTCSGVCTARAAIGEACGEVECTKATSATCDFTAQKCVARLPNETSAKGEFCGSKDVNGQYVMYTCEAGLGCAEPEEGERTCQTPAKAGEECTENRLCALGSACLFVDEKFTCTAMTIAPNEGDSCNVRDVTKPLVFCKPLSDLYCGENGKCNVSTGEVGAPCSETACDEGLFCDGESDTCKNQKNDGTACNFSEECTSGFCNNTTQKCEVAVCE